MPGDPALRTVPRRARPCPRARVLSIALLSLAACGGSDPAGPTTSWSDGWWKVDAGPPAFGDRGAGTTVAWTKQPTDHAYGEQQTIEGRVSSPASDPPGQVELWLRSGAADFALQATVELTAGSWSHTATLTTLGEQQWDARYVPAAGDALPPGSALSDVFDVGLAQVAGLKGGEATHTSCAFSWTAVAGATGYELHRDGALLKTVAGLASGTISDLKIDSEYRFSVQAVAQAPDVATLKGPPSAELLLHTGSLIKTPDQGESAWIEIKPTASGSYRSSGGWGVVGDIVAQGYWDASWGSYYGVIRYATLATTLKAGLGESGAERYANGTVKGAEVWLYKRNNTGSYGSVTLSFYATASEPNKGGQPATSGGAKHDVASSASGVGQWYAIGLANAAELAKNGKNLMLHRNTFADYAHFNGVSSGGDHCRLRLKWGWSYERSTDVAPKWSPAP